MVLKQDEFTLVQLFDFSQQKKPAFAG